MSLVKTEYLMMLGNYICWKSWVRCLLLFWTRLSNKKKMYQTYKPKNINVFRSKFV